MSMPNRADGIKGMVNQVVIEKDVCIMGGGLAGLSLALQLRKKLPEINIIVVERRQGSAPEAAFKVGESTVEIAAHYFTEVLGLREHIEKEQLPKLGLRFFFQKDGNQKIENRLECGGNEFLTSPSYQLDRGLFENHLEEQCLANGIQVLKGQKIVSVRLPEDVKGGRVECVGVEGELFVESNWVVDASGRASILKRQLGLNEAVNHKVNAAWFRLEGRVDIGQWSDDPTWLGRMGQHPRWLSTNHLMGAGYWVWIIPLSSGHTSIGLVADAAMHSMTEYNSLGKLKNWLTKHEPQCAEQIKSMKVLDFLAYRNFSFGCEKIFSQDGWSITGDAGRFLDPFYSPGSDYIAINNTLITSLISLQMSNRPIGALSEIYERVYRQLFEIHLSLYENQYSFFGDARAMVFKLVWDFSYYWSIPAFLFIQDKMTNPILFARYQDHFARIKELNQKVQDGLSRLADHGDDYGPSGFVDLQAIPCLKKLNAILTQDFDDTEFATQLRDNFDFLHELGADVLYHVAQGTNQSERSTLPCFGHFDGVVNQVAA